MKRSGLLCMAAMVVLLFAIGCSSGGGGGAAFLPPAGATTGTITGKVVSFQTGSAISGAVVSDGTGTTATASDGTYTFTDVAASRKVLTISATGYAYTSRITTVTAGVTSRVDAQLLPVTYSATIASLSTGTALSVPGSSAQVTLPANSLRTAANGSPSFPVTANLTPLDPSADPTLMPGDFTTSAGSMIESYGAMEVNFKDTAGANLNLASGQTSTIRIPVAAGATSPPATMPLFYYNASTGQWVQEGTATLVGSSPTWYYEGVVTHFSYWNADQEYNTTCVSGKVVNGSGAAVANARVISQGRDYIGTAETTSASDGTFSVSAKANATVMVYAMTSDALSNTLVVTTGSAGSVCTPLPSDLVLGAIGGAGSGSAAIRLTWGTDPSDLDSHLTGPAPTDLDPAARFHVYYSNMGDLMASPFANLDVDDVSSFGPEVITISKFLPGVYRYSVHHFSGVGTIVSSPARVELTLNGQKTVFTPPATGLTLGTDSVWQVFELNVAGDGTVTVNTLNTYVEGVSSGAVTKPAVGGKKPAITGGAW